MNGQRVNAWTRTIAAAPSRRELLGGVAGALLGGLLVGRAETAGAPATPAARTQKRLAKQSDLKAGVKWLASLQDASGGFGTFVGGSPDAGTTALVVSTLFALQNVGVAVEMAEAVAYLKQTNLAELAASGAYDWLTEIAIALVDAGVDLHDVGGADLVALLTKSWDATTGVYGGYLVLSALVVMALAVAGEPFEERAIETIAAAQIDDGSWATDGETAPGSGDPITTSLVIQTLVAIGRGKDPMIADAIAYLRSLQVGGGAFAYSAGSPPDANSTGFVISALIAAGENPKAKKWGNAASSLLAFQNESGAFRPYPDDPTDDIASTVSALKALAGASWPVLPAT